MEDDTNVGAYLEKGTEEFSAGDSPQRVFLVFGLKKQDRDSCAYSDLDCDGDTVFADEFSLTDSSSQTALLVSRTS